MSERANTQSPGPPSGSWMVPPAQNIPPLVGHEHNSYIPGEERYPLHPSMVQPHHSHSSYSTEDVKCILPHYPPPLITHLSSTTDQQHPVSRVSHHNFDQINFFKGCGPSPKFSRPPPSFLSVPPDFSKPPPSVSYDRNIPQSLESPALPQSQQSSIMSTSTSYHSPWHSGPPPQICNSQFLSQTSMDFVSGGMAPSAHAVNSTGVLFKSNSEDIWEDEDMKWLHEFQQRIKNRHQPQPPVKTVSKERTVKLMDVERKMSEAQTLLECVCKMEEEMKLVISTAEDHVWQNLVHETEQMKKKLKELTTNFQDESFIQDVKMLVNQRRMKRRRMKNKKKLLQVEKKEMEKRRQEEERKIDAWREKLELEEVEKRREKAFKAEADSILGEVRQKQNDVLRMQQLLEALITLRLTRINKGAAHGYISSTKSDQHFASTLKGIGEVVRSQMKEYELEEQTLCVMMEESASHQSSLAGKEESAVTRCKAAILKLLFGDHSPPDEETMKAYTSADFSLDKLIQRRCDWDQFIIDDDNSLAAAVPLHWVTPPSHPTPSWAKFQLQSPSMVKLAVDSCRIEGVFRSQSIIESGNATISPSSD